MAIYYTPVFIDYFRHAVRLRNLRYPLVVNPGIALSGLVGEKKSEILQKIAIGSYPKTLLLSPSEPLPETFAPFPLVAKPNQGERGMGVRLLRDREDWQAYHRRAPREYIVQAFTPGPFEVGVLFYRREGVFHVSSIGIKVRAEVAGDGISMVQELAQRIPRFRKQIERLKEQEISVPWDYVPAKDEIVPLDEIRNHRRGAEFRDGRNLISDELKKALACLIPESSGILYGRADLRCPSPEALREGKEIAIVEVNGITGEPAEIYDPGMRFLESLKILRGHWDIVAELAENALKEGATPPSWHEVFSVLRDWRRRKEFFDC